MDGHGDETAGSQRWGSWGGRRRSRSVTVTLVLGALMMLAAVAWACTPNQMKGQVWFSGTTGTNVIQDAPATELGSCPEPSGDHHDPDDGVSAFDSGDVVCVQARDLQITGLTSVPDPDSGDPMRFYELKYAAVSPDPVRDELTEEQQDNLHGDLCHNSRQTLPNLSTEHGLYEARMGKNNSLLPGGGWEDQQTALDMPAGSYTVCAATVTEPAAGVMGPVNVRGTGWYDAGQDGEPSTGHLSITVTGPGV